MSAQLFFAEYQNAPEQEQYDEFLELYNKTIKAPFTKNPNTYSDKIKDHLTPSEKHICDMVIRKTIGWQRKAVRLTTIDFMGTKYKERVILFSKSHLVDVGLLKKRRVAGGWEYCVNVFIDPKTLDKDYIQVQEEKSHSKNTLQPNMETIEQIDIPEELNLESNEQIDIPEELNFEIREQIDNAEIPQIENPDGQNCGNVDNSTVQDVQQVQNFCTSAILVPESLDLNDLKKQTEQVAKKKEKKSSVCFSIPIFTEISIWTGMGYDQTAKRYKGYTEIECKKALEILKDDCKRGVVNCPAAYFTTALKNKWVPNKHLDQKLANRARADRQAEKTYQSNLQKQIYAAEIDSEAEYIASVRASMPESELNKLTAEARQILLNGGPSVTCVITDFLIDHQVNSILSSRR